MTRLLAALLCAALALFGRAGTLAAEEVVETAEDGTVLVRYETDEQGRKHGLFERFHRNGKPAIRATYKADKRHGLERTWTEHGTLSTAYTYKDGVLHGSHKLYAKEGHLLVHQTYKRGTLHGSFKSYHPNGRLNVVTTYRGGLRQGKYEQRNPDGSTRVRTSYQADKLHGTYEVFAGKKKRITKQTWEAGRPITVDGVAPFSRSQDSIRKELARILDKDAPLPDVTLEADRLLALRQLKAYRYLVGVPYDDLTLDPTFNAESQAAAELCAALGRNSHTPPNPGWPAERYDPAARGALNSNLHGGNRACTSVRGYMDDSDPTNIQRLGHRCWALNPKMLKTGFGHENGFTAMWTTDKSRGKPRHASFIAMPPAGYAPGPWFGSHWAWSVALDPRHFDKPGGTRIIIEPLDAFFLPKGEPLAFDFRKVKHDARGIPYLLIFQPKGISLDAGRRYRVTIEGLEHRDKPRPLRYFVEFFDEKYEIPRLPRD